MVDEIFAPMCEMAFVGEETGKRITVRLAAPVPDSETGDWYCLSEIAVNEKAERRRNYGTSPFQAIIEALTRFRVFFEKQTEPFVTTEEYPDAAYVIFPKYIPWVYGLDVYQRLRGMVDAEVQKIEDELTRRREARGRKEEG
ncbi:DUF6968 family protein [Methylocystis heyeri]|uniref:DUF6968 domain-containing protein n=1 Tax=Methylocystis heyeri TaxID=391905 RepID=A0A6B8KEG5_9HYPH|nr:hypothetical protein [Methylocystis heyeri]QGM44968.1 hypothetical protein H2LOC_004285 [Methylocystis heyeri]